MQKQTVGMPPPPQVKNLLVPKRDVGPSLLNHKVKHLPKLILGQQSSTLPQELRQNLAKTGLSTEDLWPSSVVLGTTLSVVCRICRTYSSS